MDHEAIRDCPFRDRCQTYKDTLVPRSRKGPNGLGCAGRSDIYRGKHCNTFTCAYLSMVVSGMIFHKPGSRAQTD